MNILLRVHFRHISAHEGERSRSLIARCKIDGMYVSYFFSKSDKSIKNARERALNHAYYDAKNRGVNIQWLPIK